MIATPSYAEAAKVGFGVTRYYAEVFWFGQYGPSHDEADDFASVDSAKAWVERNLRNRITNGPPDDADPDLIGAGECGPWIGQVTPFEWVDSSWADNLDADMQLHQQLMEYLTETEPETLEWSS